MTGFLSVTLKCYFGVTLATFQILGGQHFKAIVTREGND